MFRHNTQLEEAPPLRVLYVDDNSDAADSAVDLLRICGFEPRACYNGPSALAEATSFRPSVYLIDLNMPGMDGDELARRLRERADGNPLVLVAVTAMSGDEARQRIKAGGFDLHFVKPVDPHQLVALVDTLWRAWLRWAHKRDGGENAG
ncbi:histidine kinase : Histidine kinase OS=Asticcacaulis sp. AC460 GN=ABAC460_15120 PE=4 SV=1: Response_reg [Gemmata massiliana]|uniref:Response regulatory domain-containing protein n=1 Tax=Gemmata massiliana TaxID=1210884 RepID=A0A6P2DHE7_9BACT|nr:response regulator [Gemmata massiliana]VTS00611.1 histidine kinase : Histidine kinase OS=Asticcacaulis sp. AC460 GN=ABAC460_15120 PE=4 SV=1: Response_reg [Gemmata massiliana]